MVTSLPNRRKTEANSTPTAPAPRTMRRLGTILLSSNSSLVTMCAPSTLRPGRSRGAEPLARTMCFASTVWFPDDPPETLMRPGPASRAWPCTRSTLFLRKRNSTPLAFEVTIFSLRFKTPAMSTEISPFTSMPCSFASRAVSSTSAEWSNALVGMQPRKRQVPPRRSSFSMQATLSPSCPARIAAT